MIAITILMFGIITIVMCLNLFDVPMSVATRRILGVILLVCFIIWMVSSLGVVTVGSGRPLVH